MGNEVLFTSQLWKFPYFNQEGLNAQSRLQQHDYVACLIAWLRSDDSYENTSFINSGGPIGVTDRESGTLD